MPHPLVVKSQKLVAIGGGSLKELATLDIDREIVRMAGSRKPRALFVPTASSDSNDYWERFQRVYGEWFKCRCEVLWLLGAAPSPGRLRRMIQAAEIIYVGGGNTLKMMRRWRRLGVDRLLAQARRRGTVLSGISAGANCWFAHGSSDSMKFYRPDDWDFIRVSGLGFLPGTCCPHYHAEQREDSFARMIDKRGGVGIALNDCTALQIDGDRFRIFTSSSVGRAYRISLCGGDVVSATLPADRRYRPLRPLFDTKQEIES